MAPRRALLMIALIGGAPAWAAPPALPNFAAVAPGIYRGGAPTNEGLRQLKAMGIRTVIDLRIERKGQREEAAAAAALGLDRLRIPMGREAPTPRQVETFLQVLDNPDRQPVFVHCMHGADRTGAMIGIWRVTRKRWDFPRTYQEMLHFGFKPYLTELKQAVVHRAKQKRPARTLAPAVPR